MELDELIENTLRRKHLEEMLSRPEREHTPFEGMDADQIKRFALFLYEENQNKRTQLDEMIARLDEIGKDLKESNKKIDTLTNALLKANSKAEKVVLEYKLRDKEYKTLEKKHRALGERLSLMNTQTYASSKSLKGIDRKKVLKGRHDDKDDFDGTPQSPVPTEEAADQPQESQSAKQSKERPERKGMTYRKQVVGTPYHPQIGLQPNPGGSGRHLTSHKKVRIVIFLYEDAEDKDGNQKYGGRSRNVLSEFIGDAKLKSLQSDGYNVYTYLDDELVDIDHLCCMAHIRAIRPITVQRKNSMFFGSVKGVKNSAVFNIFIETC